MLNQQHNQPAQQLINVQRPHQIQPPGHHRIVPGPGMQPPNQMQQGQPINMGQPPIANMQGQRPPGPMGQPMQQQPPHLMNMNQQVRPPQNQQQQMMHGQNPQQQQMRGNPQQMRGMPPQGHQLQQQPQPQMGQMRMQQQQQPNQQNMNTPPQRMGPVPNVQPNPQGMRMGQPVHQQQRLQPLPPQIHQMQQGGPQGMNRPSSQPPQQMQNVPPNTNRPPSQPHLIQQNNMNTPPQQQMRMQQPQQDQFQMQQGGPPQQHMRMQAQDQQPNQQMMAGAPQQQPGRNQMVQMPQKQPPQNMPQLPPQQSQAMRGGPMQNSPQPQMRMGPPPTKQPVQQGRPLQPIQPQRLAPPIQARPPPMQMNRPMQQMPSGSQNPPDQPNQPPQQQAHPQVIPISSNQTIQMNGDQHAIINGMQYRLVQMAPSADPNAPPIAQLQLVSQADSNQQGPPGQHIPIQRINSGQQQMPSMQQRTTSNQMIANQPPMQNQQQNFQNQRNPPNPQNQPNQQNPQSHQNTHIQPSHQMQPNQQTQQGMPPNQQNVPMMNPQNQNQGQQQMNTPQQPLPIKTPKPRNRAKKVNAQDAPLPPNGRMNTESPNGPKVMTNGIMQNVPTTSNTSPQLKGGARKILPPSLTPLAQQGPSGMNSPVKMVQQGKHMVQVGGIPPERQQMPPNRNAQNKQQTRPNQRPNGTVQTKPFSQPSTSRPKLPPGEMTAIREAIISHVKGTRKMTPEYIVYVGDELGRILKELEKGHLKSDHRYIAVQKLLALVKGENFSKIQEPTIVQRAIKSPPTEEELNDEPADETPEQREKRFAGYIQFLTDAYPVRTFDTRFAPIDDDTIRKEAEFYRQQDMKNRAIYLKENLHNIPEEKRTKAKIEYLGLNLIELQDKIRKEVKATLFVEPPTEFLINPWSIRRSKQQYMLELKQHPDRAALEKKRKVMNNLLLHNLPRHCREFREFHKTNKAKHTKVRKSLEQFIANEAKRKTREEMKNEKLRIQKLIQEDEEGYRAMLDDKKDQRLVYLLEQTDNYIESLCDLLKKQQDSNSEGSKIRKQPRKDYDGLAEEEKVKSILEKARNEEDEYENKTKMNLEDYYTTAHGIREEVVQQHFMMGGGNPNLKLKPYQLKGLEWMVSLYNNNLNGILADEMGLGKTIQTIAFITYLMEIKKTSGPFLVIVPLSTIPNWKNEFDKWASTVHLIVYKGPKDGRKATEPIIKSGKFNVLLTTFEYVIREKALLGKLRWKYMIIDEGHRLKNQHCKLTEMLNTRFQCQRRLLITGTPLQNKLPELWALLNFLLPSIFSSCSSFEQWFNAPFATTGEKVELTQEETMLIIRRLHKVLRPFLLRRLKKEVESELPDKMEFVIKCEMSALQKVLYKHMQKGLLLDGKTNTGSRSLMNSMIHLRKLCNHPFLFVNVEESCKNFWDSRFISAVDLYRVSGKLELLDRILPKLQASGHRVLMFFQMTSMMTVVEDYLAGGSIQYLRLDGSTKPDERGLLLDKFNAPNSKYFLFMLSTRAGGLGLNLQTADTVIIFDSDWNPHQDMQAQDRAHRIGQKAEVRVFRLITANSVEEKILASARFKLNVDEKVIQAGKFDNRSTGAERKQILENIIKAENESEEDEDVPNDEDINDMLSRSDEEFELFQRMDQERFARDKENRAKPRLVGDDEIPKDILRAADETDYIEKAKEEGRVPYLEVLPGTKRARKEVDYSTDTMSDDKFLDKLFDEEDSSASKSDSQSSAPAEPKKDAPVERSIVPETVLPPMPTLTFKVPRLKPLVEEEKRKHKRSESDSDYDGKSPKKHRKDDEHRKEKDLKRKQEPIEKIRIKLPGEPIEKQKRLEEESPKKKDRDHHKEEKHRKYRDDDDSTPKKKKHRDRDDDEHSEKKKKKHKHKHRDSDYESPAKSRDDAAPTSSATGAESGLPPLKLKLNVLFKMPEPPVPSSSSQESDRKEKSEEKKKSRENETEEERRARKEAKRLQKRLQAEEEEARLQEKLAKKARKEARRLEREKLEASSSSSNTTNSAAGSA